MGTPGPGQTLRRATQSRSTLVEPPLPLDLLALLDDHSEREVALAVGPLTHPVADDRAQYALDAKPGVFPAAVPLVPHSRQS